MDTIISEDRGCQNKDKCTFLCKTKEFLQRTKYLKKPYVRK